MFSDPTRNFRATRISLLGIMLFIYSSGRAHGQNGQEPLLFSINTSGSDAMAYNGDVSYSIGQIYFTSVTAISGSVAEGVQQVFNQDSEIFQLPDQENPIPVTAYPNPMVDYLFIEVGKLEGHSFSYKLLTMEGKVMEEQKLRQPITQIIPNITPSVTYLLNVYRDNVRLRTLKIIKK